MEQSTTTKLASYLSRLSPIPAFPEYTGPYKVGTVDVEIPVSELESPVPVPEGASDIHTIQFRMFYPAIASSSEKRIGWLPTPQRQHLSAYTKFLGIGPMLAEFLSFLPRHLHYTTIPVHKNATLSEPTETQRWPTMIFSHGLGGGRNSYSYVAGSLASHGIVVLCPEHRDGSAVTTFVRQPDEPRSSASAGRRHIPYEKISHEVSPEVYEARDYQLRIRCWEMALVHQAVLALDRGSKYTNLNRSTPKLDQFIGKLNVHEPGSIIFAGHSFGAATAAQFLKSTYYVDEPAVAAMEKPLFRPVEGADIRNQITEKTVIMLLDMWCLSLMSPNSVPLFNLPLPAYADVPTAPGGKAILAVESESFFKWTEHLHVKARALSPDPTAKIVTPDLYERPSGLKLPEPNFFYVVNSAHLNQSDFGILFPWLTKKIFDAEQPERALRLNLRAQLQILRTNGVPVARTSAGDMVDGTLFDKLDITKKDDESQCLDGTNDDQAIFDRSGSNPVDHWRWIDVVGLGDAGEKKSGKTAEEQVEETEPEMKASLDPSEEMAVPVASTAHAVAA
ncbi:platelet-activating factor acetylhydrolase, isoform II-domain-containing protein [Dactylonectria macrodidyma]|uniref:Putative phospholipase n=1 Tax=Dactylonectria macrodidyma TaxID=307937 RepID=A0A9P9FKF5_9HYPO|nr:platelet-activating factor acetylhydrolase, isoform II-domain-containing protein [Dactylonectria macrodidyma]